MARMFGGLEFRLVFAGWGHSMYLVKSLLQNIPGNPADHIARLAGDKKAVPTMLPAVLG